jgi:UDP-N-acetylglucosamine 2-epimerase (non-hydrolysing)
MMQKMIAHIVGTRPNFIKLAALYPKLSMFEQLVVHTGQHYDYELNNVFYKELKIPKPDYNLEIGSGTHCYQIGEMLKYCEKILMKEDPKLVIVYGDTNSTLAGALSSIKLGIPVAHVEAGLRSGLKYMHEEINRVLVDHISWLLFTPTKTAVKNLYNEGIRDGVYLTGDVMLDLFLKFKDRFVKHQNEDFILVTIHRAENTDDPVRLKAILKALVECGEEIVFPMHPRTRKRIEEFKFTWCFKSSNIRIIKPLGYVEFLKLMGNARKVITDSGGVQKEAYFLGKSCITLRKTTEWIETVSTGWNILTDAIKDKIIWAIKEFNPKGKINLKIFGDGRASEKIASIINKKIDE